MAIHIDWHKVPEKISKLARYIPRIKSSRTVSEQELLKKAAKNSKFDRGTLIAASFQISRAIAEELREGHAVKLNELGKFQLKIGAGKAVPEGERNNTESIHIEGINFTPSSAFMDFIGKPVFIWDKDIESPIDITDEELMSVLNQWFMSHDFITRMQFSALTNLRRTKATELLNHLIDKGFIYKEGNKATTIYKKHDFKQRV